MKMMRMYDLEQTYEVTLEGRVWENIVGQLIVQYETIRDGIISGFYVSDHQSDMSDCMSIMDSILKIQKSVRHEWLDFVVVSLNDTEREVEIDNRDSNLTTVHIEGGLDIDLGREELTEYLTWDQGWLDDRGVHIMFGLTVLVLYREDIQYLLENMDENNPTEE